ncbi:MAG: asparaginase [Silicimonas sp.]|nr:asparaginase [Silicimonas sp.]
MPEAAPLAEITRGPFVESIHLGHAVIAGPDGEIVEAWGDATKIILPRSSSKMLQALPLVESGAGAGLSSEQLALACASHSGAQRHVELVNRWLSDLGLEDDALCCGPQASRDKALRHAMIRDSQPVTRAHNNCSGKHAGFLTIAQHLGASLDYVDPENPVQKSVRATFEDMCGEDSPGFGIDGCSAPNFATSLTGFARAMAKFASLGLGGTARDRAVVALREAMIAHPDLVAGEGKACTILMRAANGRAVVKTGAEGVYSAILPDLQLGVALKIDDGATRAAEVAIAAILTRLGVLNADDPAVARFLKRPIENWDGLIVGEEHPAAGLI